MFRNPPELLTDRLLLRRMKRCDSVDMFVYASDPKVTRYLTWAPHPDEVYTAKYLAYASTLYREGQLFDWAIIHRSDKKMIGTVGFTRFHYDTCSAEVGYVLNPAYQGQGLATEALRAVIRFGFEELFLHRIEARYMVGNEKSRAVMERCGMQFEGVHRDEMYLRDNYISIGICAILSEEYLADKCKGDK